jgi:hypothetical protein
MKITVSAPFTAFQRGYVAGQVLQDADLESWPVAQRAAKIASLVASSNIVVNSAVPAPTGPSAAEIAATEAFEAAKAAEDAALAQLNAAKAAH